jgi:hypothetical protein
MNVTCPYCEAPALLVDSKQVYQKSYGMIWLCRPCDAFVGTHQNSKRHAPLGTLANKTTRQLRRRVHSMFDPLWKRKIEREGCDRSVARNAGYKWLSEQLGIPIEECHIGMFDDEMALKAISILSRFTSK